MNANELADELHDLDVQASQQSLNDWAEQASDMLRQQQAEIANLKAGLLSHHDIYPVKELTDEEIKFIAYPFESVYTTYDKQTDTNTVHTRFDQLGFARAILRKAQNG